MNAAVTAPIDSASFDSASTDSARIQPAPAAGRGRRRARRAVLALAAAGAVTVAGPLAAHAAQGGTGLIITPGSTVCFKQYAGYQYRATVTSNRTLGSSVALNGTVVNFLPPGTAMTYDQRTSLGNFPGAGTYKICVLNNGTSNARADISLRTDAEL